jgi:alanyl-tRNA synthetase
MGDGGIGLRDLRRVLDQGIKEFTKMAEAAEKKGTALSGEDAFMLHDTYGFPIDLTELMAEERISVVDGKVENRSPTVLRAIRTDPHRAALVDDPTYL